MVTRSSKESNVTSLATMAVIIKPSLPAIHRSFRRLAPHVRIDQTHGSELSRTKDRTTVTNPMMLGDIAENNLSAYVSETFRFNSLFSINAGLRYDYFHDQYTDKLNGGRKGKASADILSPKLSFYYHPSPYAQFYLSSGKGFPFQ